MTDTIHLDLNDLTRAHLDEAKPNCGSQCRYATPCIIGTIVPEDRRKELDKSEFTSTSIAGALGENIRLVELDKSGFASTSIGILEDKGLVEFPDAEQSRDARTMQLAFDCGDWDDVLNIAGKYVK